MELIHLPLSIIDGDDEQITKNVSFYVCLYLFYIVFFILLETFFELIHRKE